MNANIEKAASVYLNALRRLPDSLRLSFKNLKGLGPLPIDGHDATAAILITLKTYYDVQDELVAFLNKRVKGAASDFFVETVLFYLKAFIETHNLGLEACSERSLESRRGSLRPDISVWRGDDLVAVIECKTQLGRNRDKWEADFTEREVRIHNDFPFAKCFLVVLTEVNWPGFGANPRVGDRYFALSKVWPSDVDLDHIEDSIRNPIEPLFQAIGAQADGTNIASVDTPTVTDLRLRYHEFWTDFLHGLNTRSPGFTRAAPTERNFMSFKGSGGLRVGVAFAGRKYFWIELFVDVGDKEINKRKFDLLRSKAQEIESKFALRGLTWEQLDNRRASRVSLRREATIYVSLQELETLREWGVRTLLKFEDLRRWFNDDFFEETP